MDELAASPSRPDAAKMHSHVREMAHLPPSLLNRLRLILLDHEDLAAIVF